MLSSPLRDTTSTPPLRWYSSLSLASASLNRKGLKRTLQYRILEKNSPKTV
ncbi:hypothetical protein HanPSC8_Chr02g0064391 [Helianthus annuus]|nr:hypothetical protein HanPSC8_Chr02g0064391 [Helianthus annuus]